MWDLSLQGPACLQARRSFEVVIGRRGAGGGGFYFCERGREGEVIVVSDVLMKFGRAMRGAGYWGGRARW